MLDHLLVNRSSGGVFLPWGAPATIASLLCAFLDILGISRERALVWNSDSIASNVAGCQPRPIVINKCILDAKPYAKVLSRIFYSIASGKGPADGKIFLARSPNRIPGHLAISIEHAFKRLGFDIVRPETLSIVDQVRLMQSARIVAGFAGSQMHNSIFCSKGAFVVSLGDERTPNSIISNQLMCDSIAGNTSLFLPYVQSEESMINSAIKLIAKIG